MPSQRLKLFRATDFVRSTLMPGEARLAPHPGWMVAGVGAWIALACNVALWRALVHPTAAGLLQALALGLLQAAAACLVLFALDWKRTRKAAAALVLMLAATVATGLWQRGLEAAPAVLAAGAASLVPELASWGRWPVPTLWAALALPPMAWACLRQWRRLGNAQQWRVNLAGAAICVLVLGASAWAWRTLVRFTAA